MWARLQGVGISVRADTALPWPLLLLHKASQPAPSAGPESVSAAKLKAKGGKKTPTLSLPSYPYVTNHSSPHLAPRSFASSLISAAPVGSQSHHIICFSACLSTHLCHSLCYLISSRAINRIKSAVLFRKRPWMRSRRVRLAALI